MKRGTRAHETKVSLENAIDLWQLVETRFSKECADCGQVHLRVVEKVGGNLWCSQIHGSKLWHTECFVIPSDSVGPIQNGATGSKPNRDCDYRHRNAEYWQ